MAWIKKTSENVRSEKFDRISTDHYKYFRTASIKDESMKPARHTARNDTLLFQPLTIKVHPGPARSPSYPMSSLDTLCIGTSSQLLCTIVTQTFSTPGRLASVSMPLRSIIWQSECCTSLQLPTSEAGTQTRRISATQKHNAQLSQMTVSDVPRRPKSLL